MVFKEKNYEINYGEVCMGLNYERRLCVRHMGITMSEHTGIN